MAGTLFEPSGLWIALIDQQGPTKNLSNRRARFGRQMIGDFEARLWALGSNLDLDELVVAQRLPYLL